MPVEIRVEINPLYNAALLQKDTGRYLVDRLTIINDDIPRNGIIVKLLTTPYILELGAPIYIDYLGPNEELIISLQSLTEINLAALIDLPKSYISKLQAVLYDNSYDVIAKSDIYNIKLLTCNTWPGICKNNDVIAAFLVDTQPSVVRFKEQIHRHASSGCERDTINSILSEIQTLNLKIENLQHGYLRRPHRFKIYEELKQGGSCTSFDLAIAIATLAESTGLNVVIAFYDTGPVVGIVTGNQTDAINNYEKWMDLLKSGNVLCIIPENAVIDKLNSSDLKCEIPDSRGNFLLVVDANHAHSTISPISYRLIEHGIRTYINQWESNTVFSKKQIPLRFQKWKGDLLDLTFKNTLLDIGEFNRNAVEGSNDLKIRNRNIIPLNVYGNDRLSALQKILLVGDTCAIKCEHNAPEPTSSPSPRIFHVDWKYKESVEKIVSDYKKNIKELGRNNAYIGLGLIEWIDNNEDNHVTPLALVSVELGSDWRVNHTDSENIEPNFVLIEKMRQEFGYNIPEELGRLNNGCLDLQNLATTLKMYDERINYYPLAILGNFNYDSHSMWFDLHAHEDMMMQTPYVKHLLGLSINTKFDNPSDNYDSDNLHPIKPIDSSQIMAINAAISNMAFVLQGPPGTGKSQTIGNMICELLYRGKTVLFVSAKPTALNVISKQMNEVGFRNFYLDLSGQVNKKNIIEKMWNAVSTHNIFSKSTHESDKKHIEYLNKYFDSIFSSTNSDGISFYDAYNKYLEYSKIKINDTKLNLEPFSDHIKHDPDAFVLEIMKLLPSREMMIANPKKFANYSAVSKSYKNNGKQALLEINRQCNKLKWILSTWKISQHHPIDNILSIMNGAAALSIIGKTELGLFPTLSILKDDEQSISDLKYSLSRLNSAFRNTNIDNIKEKISLLENSIQQFKDTIFPRGLDNERSSIVQTYPASQTEILKSYIKQTTATEWRLQINPLPDEQIIIDSLFNLSKKNPIDLEEKIHNLIDDITHLIDIKPDYSHIDPNPFVAEEILSVCDQIRSEWKYEIKPAECYSLLSSAKTVLQQIMDFCSDSLGKIVSIKTIAKSIEWIASELNESMSGLPRPIVEASRYSAIVEIIPRVLSEIDSYNKSRETFIQRWHKDILREYSAYLDEYNYTNNCNILTRTIQKKKLLKSINNYTKGKPLSFEEVSAALNIVGRFKNCISRLNGLLEKLYSDSKKTQASIIKEQKIALPIVELIEHHPKAAELAWSKSSCIPHEYNLRYLCQQLQSRTRGMNIRIDWQTVDLDRSKKILTGMLKEIHEDIEILQNVSELKKKLRSFEKRIDEFDRIISDYISEISNLIENSDNEGIGHIELSYIFDCMKHNMEISISHLSKQMAEIYNPLVKVEYKTNNATLDSTIDTQHKLIRWMADIADYWEKTTLLKERYGSLYENILDIYVCHDKKVVENLLNRDTYKLILDNIVKNNLNIKKHKYGLLDEHQNRAMIQYDSEFLDNRNEIGNYLKSRIDEIDPNLKSMVFLRNLSGKHSCTESSREILSELSDVLLIINPCVIASVQSVSKLLDFHKFKFDYVIYDESSQIPVAEAIGSLARGACPIVVGDVNQLPPTKFFKIKNSASDEYVESESFLEECISNGFPTLSLTWHYRSNHESLIAFSNNEFYENRLITFPSVTDRSSKVQFRSVNGIYDRGGKSTNEQEADAIVNELFEMCSDRQYVDKSIGIITFGTNQMDLIKEKIKIKLSREPNVNLERLINCSDEPLFVKNLETIQGDERDVILISVCYGKDVSGKLIMNFGPLNQDGGWKRLNVAITRARDEMMVFSSIHYPDIVTNSTSKRGILELKKFLRYAEEGVFERKALSADTVDPLLPAVAQRIQSWGYATDLNIGKSELRIDIAVIDPDNKDRYILAILLDKNLYVNSRNPIDRDYTKMNVLKKMGWTVFRIWTVDWYCDEKSVLKNLKQVLSGIENH